MHAFLDGHYRYRALILFAIFIMLLFAIFSSLTIYYSRQALAQINVQKIKKMITINCYLHDYYYDKLAAQRIYITRYPKTDRPSSTSTCAIAKPLLYPFGYWQLNYNNELTWVNAPFY